jgi:hypothetical protein
VRADTVNNQGKQQKDEPALQVSELACFGQLRWVGCHVSMLPEDA